MCSTCAPCDGWLTEKKGWLPLVQIPAAATLMAEEEGAAVVAATPQAEPDEGETSRSEEVVPTHPSVPHQRIAEGLNDLCLFVANLPSSFTDEELEHHLRSLLSRFGTIHSTKAARDKKLRPFCFVQFRGAVQPEVFTQPHYLGGRSLRLEKSRVRSNDLSAAAAAAAARGTPSPAPMDASVPSKWSAASYGLPPILFYTLVVSGFTPEEGTRRTIFHRFKRYGYVLGVELQWISSSTKIAYIYYENEEAVQAAIHENNGIEALGGTLKCEVAGHSGHDQNHLGVYPPFPTAATTMYYAGAGWYGTAAAGGIPGMMAPVPPSATVPASFVFVPPVHPHVHHPAAAATILHPQQQGNHSFGHRF